MATIPSSSSINFSHRNLNILTVASAIGAAVVLVLYFMDSRELLGVSIWEKPLKFLISSAVYGATFSWFYSLVAKAKKAARRLGDAIAALLAIELVVIIGLAAAGYTSHFNVSSGFLIFTWSVMATAISMVWMATFGLGALIWRTTKTSSLIRAGIRWGVATSLFGMGIAFTMTSPTSDQLDDYQGIAGAHTVGAADGGEGLPFLGWSTVAGDLRISHFFGLHALQVLPVVAVLLALAITNARTQKALLHGAAVFYALTVVVLYVQALAGQSIVAPSSETMIAFAASASIAIIFGLLVRLLSKPEQELSITSN